MRGVENKPSKEVWQTLYVFPGRPFRLHHVVRMQYRYGMTRVSVTYLRCVTCPYLEIVAGVVGAVRYLVEDVVGPVRIDEANTLEFLVWPERIADASKHY